MSLNSRIKTVDAEDDDDDGEDADELNISRVSDEESYFFSEKNGNSTSNRTLHSFHSDIDNREININVYNADDEDDYNDNDEHDDDNIYD